MKSCNIGFFSEAAMLRQKRNGIGENINSLVTSVQGNMVCTDIDTI